MVLLWSVFRYSVRKDSGMDEFKETLSRLPDSAEVEVYEGESNCLNVWRCSENSAPIASIYLWAPEENRPRPTTMVWFDEFEYAR